MKRVIIVITFFAIGLVTVTAQTSRVPKPTTPTYTRPLNRDGNDPRLNLTQVQMQKWFEIEDQRKYLTAMHNEGRITREEYNTQDQQLQKQAYEIWGTYITDISSQIAYMYSNGDIEEAIKLLWGTSGIPGYPSDQLMRGILGFAIPQPIGTRSMFTSDYGFTINLRPYSDQVYNTLKQQIEAGLGASLVRYADFENLAETQRYEYEYVLRSNKSANGKPYQIVLTRSRDPKDRQQINIQVNELRRDP